MTDYRLLNSIGFTNYVSCTTCCKTLNVLPDQRISELVVWYNLNQGVRFLDVLIEGEPTSLLSGKFNTATELSERFIFDQTTSLIGLYGFEEEGAMRINSIGVITYENGCDPSFIPVTDTRDVIELDARVDYVSMQGGRQVWLEVVFGIITGIILLGLMAATCAVLCYVISKKRNKQKVEL